MTLIKIYLYMETCADKNLECLFYILVELILDDPESKPNKH